MPSLFAVLFTEQVTQLIGQPLPAQMYYLKIYLELMEGASMCCNRIVWFQKLSFSLFDKYSQKVHGYIVIVHVILFGV